MTELGVQSSHEDGEGDGSHEGHGHSHRRRRETQQSEQTVHNSTVCASYLSSSLSLSLSLSLSGSFASSDEASADDVDVVLPKQPFVSYGAHRGSLKNVFL